MIFILAGIVSCNTSSSIFAKKTPHEKYQDKITTAGLDKTALGKKWITAAEESLKDSGQISLPFRETGYFAAERPSAEAYLFSVKRGEKIMVYLNLQSVDTPALFFAELWNVSDSKKKLISAMESPQDTLRKVVKSDGEFLLRLQPELLRTIEYTVTITSGPSLAFPVDKSGHPRFISYWGAGRDAGTRKHEGVDIRADFRTPALAAAKGYISRVGNNHLGGKVAFLRDENTGDNLYYAHLDSQIVKQGQSVNEGDTIGLIGKTGNARNTVPHLHFGIYTSGGAINPIDFIRQQKNEPPEVNAPLDYLGRWVHAVANTGVYEAPESKSSKEITLQKGEAAFITAASKKWYKIGLPDKQRGYVRAGAVADKVLKEESFDSGKTLLASPSADSPGKKYILKGQSIAVIGSFQNFLLVNADGLYGWIEK